jgi:hypothetical protein
MSEKISERMVVGASHVVILGAGASIAAYYAWGGTGPKLPSMQDLLEVLDLRKEIERCGYDTEGLNFEAFFSALASRGENEVLRRLIENRVYEYFASLRLPIQPTIYDHLVLSLRNKDVIATFNWDPFLIQAYVRCGESVGVNNLPKLVFLHGNVAVGVCHEHAFAGRIGGCCRYCRLPLAKSKLLYPVGQKDYTSDPFIKKEWDTLRSYLRDGYYLTVFGYSAPVTDLEARELMLMEWAKENKRRELAEVDIVDIKNEQEIEANWSDFFFSHHYSTTRSISDSYLFRFPRRSCDAFFSASMCVDPWWENPFPQFETLEDLFTWVRPLIEEEISNADNEKSLFSGDPLMPNKAAYEAFLLERDGTGE